MKVISILCNFHVRGGAQNVCIQLALKLNEGEAIILTDTPVDQIHPHYRSFERLTFSLFHGEHSEGILRSKMLSFSRIIANIPPSSSPFSIC